ncbi:hypothetical protein C0991_006197, partial [Blastosporella zonata]
MPPTVEIVRFPGSDAFLADPLAFKEGLSIATNMEGNIGLHYGVQTEDTSTGHIFVTWESYEHYIESKKLDTFTAFTASLDLARSGPWDVDYVQFGEDVAVAFSSPVTEIATLRLYPDPNNREKLLDDLVTLREYMSAHEECRAYVIGESKEKGTVFVLLGWTSVE